MSQAVGEIAERALLVGGVRIATAVNSVAREALGRTSAGGAAGRGHAWADYRPILERFAAERRVAALDWPGFGASDKPSPASFAYSAEGYAALVGPWMDGLGLGRAVLLGNSVGGAAAVLHALAQPQRVAGLALVSPGGFTPPGLARSLSCHILGTPWVLARVEPAFTSLYLGPANAATRQIVAAHRAQRSAPTYRATIAAYAALWRSFDTPAAELTPRARDVRARAIVVRGALDPVISAADAQRATESLGERGAFQVVLPEAGHLPFLQQPAAFLSAVRGLLETVEGG